MVVAMKSKNSEVVAYIVIAVGMALLILTFAIAYSILISVADIATSRDLAEAIGMILGPIAEAVIKVMFLGIMGWAGSIATMRGIQLYRETKTHNTTQASETKTKEKSCS
ncbi:MAG: hypothetical protein QXG11_04400 [Candidatus Bathyarchaeia archaeon]